MQINSYEPGLIMSTSLLLKNNKEKKLYNVDTDP